MDDQMCGKDGNEIEKNKFQNHLWTFITSDLDRQGDVYQIVKGSQMRVSATEKVNSLLVKSGNVVLAALIKVEGNAEVNGL